MLGSLDLGSVRGLLTSLYHGVGPGRKPYDPVYMLKAQLLKHLFRVPIDRRLALLLRKDRRVAESCGFRDKTPSHGLFTQFKHRLGKDGYENVFSALVNRLLSGEVVEGEVVALDSTAVKAYSQRALVCIERVFSRAKEWLLLDGLRVRGMNKLLYRHA